MSKAEVPRSLPLQEEIIRLRLVEARKHLESEAGLNEHDLPAHYKLPPERAFTAAQRSHTTLLFGGLTWKHDRLIQGALESLGYKCEALSTPDLAAFQTGRELGNNGQCNPTYFTVGNLINHLRHLEHGGMSREEICENHVFFTAGACGPCRFGMYEAEYRLALRNAGFGDFRVILFQQSAGMEQEMLEAGISFDLDFFMGILYAMMIGDLLGEVANQIRPYELEAGATDLVLDACVEEITAVLKSRRPFDLRGLRGRWRSGAKYAAALKDDLLVKAMVRARQRFDEVRVDRLRPKPVVKITGEFWAQTTEGDGNFNMFPFLEREGAEILAEPVATWILYMVHGAQNKLRDRKGLAEGLTVPDWRRPLTRLKAEWRTWRRIQRLGLGGRLVEREYGRLRRALGGTAHAPIDQFELEREAHPYYNSRAAGGEGHLEVAKNIYYHHNGLCHMVLSLKPFGCMPSTQSDGAQAAVQSRYPDMIYLPIETSGEGEINAQSRVQMALGEARVKAREEFERVMAECGLTLAELQARVAEHPELSRGLYRVPHADGIAGRAANFVMHLADRPSSTRKGRGLARAAVSAGGGSGGGREVAS